MNISGVVVYTRPDNRLAMQDKLSSIPGVEVHANSIGGKLVVTVEENDVRALAEKVTKLQNIPGVISVSMVYHHSENIGQEEYNTDFSIEVQDCGSEVNKIQEASS